MPFVDDIREKVLVLSHRRCCVCHDFAGRSVNVHHIIQEADGGLNTIENAICLCLRCHAEAGHFNSRHPLGTKYSPKELHAHRDQWWRHYEENPEPSSADQPELWCNGVELVDLAVNETPKVVFQFENIGAGNAYELRILSGVHIAHEPLTSAPPELTFRTPTPTTTLPKLRIMTKTLPFRRAITSDEAQEITRGSLHVYAYAVLTYSSRLGTATHERILRTCHKYNPITTFFQNTPFHNSADWHSDFET